VKVEREGTRPPPIQWSVETSTPSTSTRPLSAGLPDTRSYPNGMDAQLSMSNCAVIGWPAMGLNGMEGVLVVRSSE
jgi:hypothetical protein